MLAPGEAAWRGGGGERVELLPEGIKKGAGERARIELGLFYVIR